MKTIKENLKNQAKELRELKSNIRHGMQYNRSGVWEYQIKLLEKKEQFRYEHIAYCMLRGREYEEIEQKTRPDNAIDMSKVESIFKTMQKCLCKRLTEQEKYNV